MSVSVIAVQMDAPERLNPKGDSTIVLLREAAARGMTLYYYHPSSLQLVNKAGNVSVLCKVQRLHIQEDTTHWFRLDTPEIMDLRSVDVVLMRQDPPFDMHYLTASWLLDNLPPQVRVLNNPTSVRNAPEKLLPLLFAESMPDSCITSDAEQVRAQLARYHDIIIKPLHGFGGHDVFRLRSGGDNVESLIEHLCDGRTWYVVQPFLPDVATSDIRVVLIHGNIAGAIGRIPATDEVRANLRVGGTAVATRLSVTQKELAERVGKACKERGLLLVGLDFIGEALTEINITSPTGLKAVDDLYGVNCAAMFWDGLQG